MRRFAILMIPVVAITTCVSGCGGPVETRIQTQAGPALPSAKQYSFTAKPEQSSEAYQTARNMVADALERRNFTAADDAPVLVNIALANRPASIAMTTVENAGENGGENAEPSVIAAKKKRKPLQSCDDVEHRLTINMVSKSDGSTIYSGTAAEYHCKGSVEQSLPHLVNAALSGLGETGQTENVKTLTRSGLE